MNHVVVGHTRSVFASFTAGSRPRRTAEHRLKLDTPDASSNCKEVV